ncbi:MAG: SHOCT domain-containing protein [Elainellaceae cyanobacterium]
MTSSSLTIRPRRRRNAIVLAFAGVLLPGMHKFYLGEWRWGIVYLLVAVAFPISRIASLIEGLWYCAMSDEVFDHNFNRRYLAMQQAQALQDMPNPKQVESVAEALRQLDRLRQDGLISEYEFEQKRRQWLDRLD